ncbi:hypothetical protein [Sorangium sp. So ce693]|uniref:hypothetical protein n=1 Tax=Sorangium sp. So ce693 TaxID=3133318 RepID=UPI003F645735
MKTWEYLLDSIGSMTNDDERMEWLNERGREGWELISERDRGNKIQYIFKRPKESA